MLVHAPAKLNLGLYLGRARPDGLHELCSLFEPLALADLLRISGAERDEVVCPGVEGENLAARALAALRERGWDAPPLRIEIEKRTPVAAGLGGGSADAAAVLRLATSEGVRPLSDIGLQKTNAPPRVVADLPAIAAELGADVPSQLRPALALVRGAGERVEPLPAPAEHAALLLPSGGGLSTKAVFDEADRLGLGRDESELDAIATDLRAAAGAGASPLTYAHLLVNDLEPAARSLRPDIATLDLLHRTEASAVFLSGSGPTAVGLFPSLADAERAAASLDRDDAIVCIAAPRNPAPRSAPVKLPGTEPQRKWAKRLAIVAALGAAYYLFTQVLDLETLLEHVAKALGPWTYLLVAFFAFAETGAFIGLIAPGETVMLLGGAVAGQGTINVYVLIALAWTMACAGDITSFYLGRRLGREFLLKHGPRFGFGHDRLEQVEDFFSRHGGKTIFLGRFVGFVRAFAPFIAGSSGMRFRQFFPYSVLGCGIWISVVVVIGYVFSRSIDTAINYAGKGAVILGTLIVVVVGVVWATRYLREPENRREAVRWLDDHSWTRWITALGRRYETQLRFVGDRLTPGGSFGLEFTSLMAVLAVAIFVLVAYIVVVSENPGPTPGDETAIEVAEALRCGFMTGFSKVITFLGSGGFVWALTAVCAAGLAWRRRWAELCVLLGGMVLITIGFHEIKAAVDRPRPPDRLVDTSGSSFPSGHAAHSVIYVWAATTIVVRLRPGMARATLVVVAGIILTALVGLSRVYLNVHYLSDVSSGWALGAACFSFCAAIGLVVSQLRHNPTE